MKSNYALASFPLKCNLDHLSELLKREQPWRLTENTCSNHGEGSFSGEPASLLALCNLKYGVTFSWAAFLAKIFISKKSGTAGYTDLYLHKRGKKRMVRNKRDQNRKLRLNRHPTLVTNTASRAMPLIHLGTLNKTSYIKILIFKITPGRSAGIVYFTVCNDDSLCENFTCPLFNGMKKQVIGMVCVAHRGKVVAMFIRALNYPVSN